jgi:2-keto-4-pentenoate hydratase/2-oxohepta-3-ene-1,7-dioic acid hydratase in catechol pathway
MSADGSVRVAELEESFETLLDLGSGPSSATDFICSLPQFAERVEQAASSGQIAVADVTLLPPIPRPSKFFAVGLNYADHAAESGVETPEFPVVFAKMPSAIIGPFGEIWRPRVSTALDYEGELGFVIGKRCRHVSREQAGEVIAGYTIINDVSVRDWQWRSPQWTLGKSFDTHAPMGPCLVTSDQIDPHNLSIRTLVNASPRQEANTRDLIFDCFALVEHLSQVCTLEPGDLVATGTPGGVGAVENPPRYLAPGDVVRVEIEGIGAIENQVVEEPANSLGADPCTEIESGART